MGQCCSYSNTSNFRNDGETNEDIARQHFRLKQYDQALLHFKKAAEFYIRKFGPLNDVLITIYKRIIKIYELQGKFEEEMEYYKKTMDIYERLYGDTDKNVEEICEAIAMGYWNSEYFEEASRYFELLIRIQSKTQDSKSLIIAGHFEKLGMCYESTQRYRRASNSYLRAIEIKKELGIESHSIIHMISKLAQLYLDHVEEYSKAKELYENLISLYLESRGEIHNITCQAYLGFGRSKILLQEYESSIPDLERSLEIGLRTDWPEPEFKIKIISQIYIFLGVANEALGRKKESLIFEQKWIEFQLEEDSSQGYAFVLHSRRLGEVLHQIGLYDDAIAHYKIAQEALNILSGDYVEMARIFLDYSLSYIEQKEMPKALDMIEKAKDLLARDFIQYDDYIETDKHLGIYHSKLEQYPKAIQCFKLALDQYNEKYGQDHISTIECNFLLGYAYYLKGDAREGLKYIMKAYLKRKSKSIVFTRKYGTRKALEMTIKSHVYDLSMFEKLQTCPKAFENEILRLKKRAEVFDYPKASPTEGEIWSELVKICTSIGQDLGEILIEMESARNNGKT